MSAQLRLLYSSNAFWAASGYGVQGKSLLPRLAELPEFNGRESIAQFAWWGLDGGLHHVEGFRIYPKFDDPYGNDVIGAHAQHFGANLVISLIDVWVMKNTARQIAPALWCPWLPIDHDPVPQQFLDSLAGAHLPLTYAKWGHNMLSDAGVENVYIPHGIETGVYKVLSDREEVRKFKKWLTGDEETFLCAMVAANKGFPDRKWFQGQLECFRDFVVGLERQGVDTSKIKLYLHTIPNGVHGGVDFHTLANRLGIHDRLIFPHPYLYRLGYPPEHLALVYNAADVLLSVSMSEGFGIPIIEAQACGTPVIATNFSAMPELVRWGHLVDVADRVLTGMHSYHALPSKPSMVDKLNRLYEAWTVCGGEWPLSKRIATQDLIHAEYSWDTIVREQWRPLMARLAQEAPPLDARYQVGGVVVPQAPVDDVTAFVDAVNGEDKPKRRVGPFVPRIPAPKEEIDDEVTVALAEAEIEEYRRDPSTAVSWEHAKAVTA
jgi:glycosyltransferase involved in cell wall biosynthesis